MRTHGTAYHLIRKEDQGLRDWITTQRDAYYDKLPKLTQERIDKLNSIGFVWTRTVYRPVFTFTERLEQCRQFKAKHGHLSVPFLSEPNEDGSEPTEQEREFRIWVQKVRKKYKTVTVDKVSSRLSRTQIQALTELGFDWRLPTMQQEVRDLGQDRFATRVEQLKKVIEVCGTCNDKKSILSVYPKGQPLVEWAKTIRRQYHRMTRGERTTLTPERMKMLEEIGFDFNPRSHYAPPKTGRYKRFKGMRLEDNEYREVQSNIVTESYGESTAEMNADPDDSYEEAEDVYNFRESAYL
jgi:hypothetical protein